MGILSRVAVMLVVPLCALLGFLAIGTAAKSEVSQNMATVSRLSTDGVVLSFFVHELQRERGLSAGLFAGGGAAFSDELAAQRLATDTKASSAGVVRSD